MATYKICKDYLWKKYFTSKEFIFKESHSQITFINFIPSFQKKKNNTHNYSGNQQHSFLGTEIMPDIANFHT